MTTSVISGLKYFILGSFSNEVAANFSDNNDYGWKALPTSPDTRGYDEVIQETETTSVLLQGKTQYSILAGHNKSTIITIEFEDQNANKIEKVWNSYAKFSGAVATVFGAGAVLSGFKWALTQSPKRSPFICAFFIVLAGLALMKRAFAKTESAYFHNRVHYLMKNIVEFRNNLISNGLGAIQDVELLISNDKASLFSKAEQARLIATFLVSSARAQAVYEKIKDKDLTLLFQNCIKDAQNTKQTDDVFNGVDNDLKQLILGGQTQI